MRFHTDEDNTESGLNGFAATFQFVGMIEKQLTFVAITFEYLIKGTYRLGCPGHGCMTKDVYYNYTSLP